MKLDIDNLSWQEYGYINESGKLRPKLNVKIIHGGRFVDVLGLLDSGGDCTIMNAEFAKGLGIDLEKCKEVDIGGIFGSEIKGHLAKVRISLQGFEEEFSIEVRFVEKMRTDIILGQSDIFENFLVVFDRKKRKFYLARK